MDLSFDGDGHLANAEAWSETVALTLAQDASIELGPDHWRVIKTLRLFHKQTGVTPSMRPLVRLLRDHNAADLASSIKLLRLFPNNPARLAAKIAGLPRPDKCL